MLSLKEAIVLKAIVDHNERERERLANGNLPPSVSIPCTSGILRSEVDYLVKSSGVKFKTPRGTHGLEIHVEEIERSVRLLRGANLLYDMPADDPGVQRFAQTTRGAQALADLEAKFPDVSQWSSDNLGWWIQKYNS